MSTEAAEQIGRIIAGVIEVIDVRCELRDEGFTWPGDPKWERKLREAVAVLEQFKRQAAGSLV